MATETLELTSSCRFEAFVFDNLDRSTEVSLDYTEHSYAHGSCDSETCVPLTREDAERIVAFLQQHFKLEK